MLEFILFVLKATDTLINNFKSMDFIGPFIISDFKWRYNCLLTLCKMCSTHFQTIVFDSPAMHMRISNGQIFKSADVKIKMIITTGILILIDFSEATPSVLMLLLYW